MEWRLKRIGGLGAEWASVEGFGAARQWSWTTKETDAFSAHNRYIVEALQRRAPDWLRFHTEVEPVPNDEPVRKRTAKREDMPC